MALGCHTQCCILISSSHIIQALPDEYGSNMQVRRTMIMMMVVVNSCLCWCNALQNRSGFCCCCYSAADGQWVWCDGNLNNWIINILRALPQCPSSKDDETRSGAKAFAATALTYISHGSLGWPRRRLVTPLSTTSTSCVGVRPLPFGWLSWEIQLHRSSSSRHGLVIRLHCWCWSATH